MLVDTTGTPPTRFRAWRNTDSTKWRNVRRIGLGRSALDRQPYASARVRPEF